MTAPHTMAAPANTDLAEQFKEWLRTKPADEAFNPLDVHGCVGFQFYRDSGYPISDFGVWSWVDTRGKTHGADSEVGRAVDLAIHFGGPVTFGALLECLS